MGSNPSAWEHYYDPQHFDVLNNQLNNYVYLQTLTTHAKEVNWNGHEGHIQSGIIFFKTTSTVLAYTQIAVARGGS